MYYCKWQKTDVFTPTWSAPRSSAPRKQGSSSGAAAEPRGCAAIRKGAGLRITQLLQSLLGRPQSSVSRACDFDRIKNLICCSTFLKGKSQAQIKAQIADN